MSTFCKRLWDRVYVDQLGEVYACCKFQPAKLGNLYEKDFMEVWNSPEIQHYRKESIEGKLHCFERCTLLSPEDKAHNVVKTTSLTVEETDLKKVRLMFGEGCNIACIMCKQDHRDRVMLTSAVWKDKIPYHAVKVVEFQGGEPLFITEGRDCYRYLTEEVGKQVNVITNGLIINEEWAERLVKGSDYIIISINAATKQTHEIVNAGSRWEKVMDGVQRLVEAKARFKSKIEMIGHMTIVTQNVREVAQFIALADRIGLDTVEFGYDQPTVPPWLIRHPKVKDCLIEEIRTATNQASIKIDENRLVHLGLIGSALSSPPLSLAVYS